MRAEAADATRSRASALIDEQADEVKAMNAMVAYAKCATIRDAQLQVRLG